MGVGRQFLQEFLRPGIAAPSLCEGANRSGENALAIEEGEEPGFVEVPRAVPF